MKNRIIEIAKENWADAVGFAPASRFDADDPIFKIMPETKTVICLVFRVLRGIYRGIEEGSTFYQYTTMAVENMEETIMPMAQIKVANFIEGEGFTALPQRRHQNIMTEENDTNPEVAYDSIYRGVTVENQMNFVDSAVKCGVGEKGFHGALLIPSATTEETDTEAIDPAVSAEEGDTESPTHPADPGVTESDTAPDTAPPLPPSSETLPPEPPAESESAPPSSVFPETEPENTTQSPTPETQAPSVNTESPTEPTTEPTIEPPSAPPPVPDGCFPIASQDRSEALRGVGYIHNEGATLPTALPTDSPWRVVNPTVLIVNTHPCEGFHDGSPWYDPTQGGLAQTDSPNAPDGVVALGVTLTRALRDRGVTVIHLRIPTTPEESSSALYDRTQSMIRYYCRSTPISASSSISVAPPS
jgi:hypothetical protein